MHVRSCMRGSTDRCFLRSQPGQGDEVQRRANNTQRAARTNPCKWEEREQLWQEGSGGWRKSVGVSVGRNLQRHRSGPPPGIHTGLKKGLNEKGSKNKCEIVWVLWLEGSLCHKSQFTKKKKTRNSSPERDAGFCCCRRLPARQHSAFTETGLIHILSKVESLNRVALGSRWELRFSKRSLCSG